MPEKEQLSKEAFAYLLQQAGLELPEQHLTELYPYVCSVLSGMESLKRITVDDIEPEMTFRPPEG